MRLAFGTDWNVAPLNPMLGLYAAVTRATLDGKNPNGWFPEQKLTVAEAVEAYTMGSAYAEFQEKDKGSITPGKLADMVLLSDDIFTIDPVKIRDVKVLDHLGGRENRVGCHAKIGPKRVTDFSPAPCQFTHLPWVDSQGRREFCTGQDVLTAILTPSQPRRNFH